MMFLLKSTHNAALADAVATERKAQQIMTRDAIGSYKRSLEAERSITASLRAEIEAMKPDYLFGQKRREQNKRADEKRNAKRVAAKAKK